MMLSPSDEFRLWFRRRFGSYHRWHKLYIHYCIYTIGEVDVDALREKIIILAMLDGRKSLAGITEQTITQVPHYERMEDWALWRTFLVLLRNDMAHMRSMTVLRMLAITSVLQERRRKDVQKGRSPYIGIYWQESDL